MMIKDTFPYLARWDSVGLDCSNCINFKGPENWPDKGKACSCKLYNISLAIELGENGYKLWEWFCKSFQNNTNESAFPMAIAHFENTKNELNEKVLYRFYSEDGYLKEYPFETLAKI